jgi:Zn-dependent M28 family amino/carboxypeptidase
MGITDTRLDSFMIDSYYRDQQYQQWQYNVVASIRGSLYPDSVCILGAHYDDIVRSGDPFIAAPGANDNASGVAAMLETARVLEKNSFLPEKTIRFIAFGAEELGLYGSTDYAARAVQNSESISMMLNNDMIAYEPGTDPAGWKVDIMDYENSGGLRAEAEKMCEKFTSLGYVNDNTYSHQSDSYPFSLRGYRALFFFAYAFDPDYHSMDDLPEHCNFEYCSEVVRVSCAMLVYNN